MSGLKFVFCEGKDDEAVINCVAQSIGIADLLIENIDGKSNLRSSLKTFRLLPEFVQGKVASVGVIRDGDAAFQSVCDALLAHGFSTPDSSGDVVEEAIKMGVFIIGPNNGRGMLEDLCLKSVSDLPEFRCVDEYFRCVAERSERKEFSSKAKVRAWMASHRDYDLKVGKAAEQGYWPCGHAAFNPLKDFLKRLCSTEKTRPQGILEE